MKHKTIAVIGIVLAMLSIVFWAIGQQGPRAAHFRPYVLVPVLLIVWMMMLLKSGKKKGRKAK